MKKTVYLLLVWLSIVLFSCTYKSCPTYVSHYRHHARKVMMQYKKNYRTGYSIVRTSRR